MAPNDDADESRPAAEEGSEVASKPQGRVRGAPPRQRPARVRSSRSRPTGSRNGAGEAAGPRVRADAAVDPSQKRKIILLSVLTFVVLAVAVGAFVIAQGAKTPRTSAPSQGGPTTTAVVGEEDLARTPGPTLPDAAFTGFRDDETGFSMKYPKDWQRYVPADRSLRLVASPNQQDRVSVRVTLTDEPTTPENIKNIKAFTDGGIGSNETVKVLDQKPVSLNGLIGYYYLYTYTDEKSGLQAAHAHYFLFQGRKMNAIVFQALPAERFQDLKGVFDQMLLSFRSDPLAPDATIPQPQTPEPPVTTPK